MSGRTRRDWAPLPLRLMLGIAFIIHGIPKLFTVVGHEQFVSLLQSIGVPIPAVAAWLVAALEVFGGAGLVLGMLVVPTALLLLIEMLVALFFVHLRNGFSFIHIVGMSAEGPVFGMPGYEVNLLYISGLLSLIISGAGALAIGGRSNGVGREPPPQRTA